MEYASQLCTFGNYNTEAEALCELELEKTSTVLIGTDYLRFILNFPTDKGPSLLDVVIFSDTGGGWTLGSRFIYDRTKNGSNPLMKYIKKRALSSGRASRLIVYTRPIEKFEETLGPGSTSPGLEGPGDISPGDISPSPLPTREKRVVTGTYFSPWNTSEYIPWMTMDIPINKIESSRDGMERILSYLNRVVRDIIVYRDAKRYDYPFEHLEKDKSVLPSRGSGVADMLFTMLNTITGIYNREEYAILYPTRICYAGGIAEKKKERLRQASLLSHYRLPMNEKKDDIAKFDTYSGDWGKLRAVICLVNMQPQEEVKDKKKSLRAEDELSGSHWVALIFTTGTMQNVSVSGLESRKKQKGRKLASERRMYLIDPYVVKPAFVDIEGRREMLKTKEYATYRQNTLNRACWQCYEAGLLSRDVICTSGYTPNSTILPHKVAIYGKIPKIGILDYLLPYTLVRPPSQSNEIYYDRKSLVVGTPEEKKFSTEADKEVDEFMDKIKKEEGEVHTNRFTMVVENLYPTCTLLYETPFVEMTPLFLLSTIQTLLLSDIRRENTRNMFPYFTSEIFLAMAGISATGYTSSLVYNKSKKGIILEYKTYLSPYNTYSSLYKEITLPVFSINIKVSRDILAMLMERYYK